MLLIMTMQMRQAGKRTWPDLLAGRPTDGKDAIELVDLTHTWGQIM